MSEMFLRSAPPSSSILSSSAFPDFMLLISSVQPGLYTSSPFLVGKLNSSFQPKQYGSVLIDTN